MGNDSGIGKKSRQRTVPHKKHAVFPGMRLSTDVKIEYGVIKPISQRQYSIATNKKATLSSNSDPLWAAFEKASILLDKGSNSSAAMSNRIERDYAYAYRQLVREGKAMKIKRKYSKN